MSDLNVVSVTGRVGKVELKYTQGGKAILEMSIAVGGSKKINGQWEKTTTWLRTSQWDQSAERLSKMINKGDRIAVSGQLEVREYERKEGGKGTSVEIAFSEIVLLGGKPGERQQSDGPGAGNTDDIPFAPVGDVG